MTQTVRVVLSGVATVAEVGTIARSAREALDQGLPVVLDLKGLERADISIVQLCLALARSARGAGLGFSIEGDLAPLVAAGAGSPDVSVLLGGV